MKNNLFNVSAFLGVDTKRQTEIIGFAAKAMRNMQVHEAVVSGEYRYWKNATNISENICGDQNFYLRKFYKQMDNIIRVCKGTEILNRVPENGSHKRALFRELEQLCNEVLGMTA